MSTPQLYRYALRMPTQYVNLYNINYSGTDKENRTLKMRIATKYLILLKYDYITRIRECESNYYLFFYR